MTDPVSSIRNLGPAYEASLARVGIHSADALRAIGADAAYAKLLQNGDRPHFIGYYALVMALQGRPWNDCKGPEKAALRVKFDMIKDQHQSSDTTAFEDALNLIGTGRRR
ncbi:TfoX/Sxy family protein [Litoreibacter janthinus]|uniref:TfoX C-terminal domain-containing protein n=1 Tax=Litoreibacter janthinus TaxID=670154 RepID=A0A1I6H084_9RHOB|nr:TfoX/Sxy family protein [Litoreibacter janthinus]SFR47845.1 TfoX C-terminal domain-containing protein [Litoreibacter janthinus]